MNTIYKCHSCGQESGNRDALGFTGNMWTGCAAYPDGDPRRYIPQPVIYWGSQCARCAADSKTAALCPQKHRPATLFDRWSELNSVGCDGRSRFDVLRERLPRCRTIREARELLRAESFDARYPLLPRSVRVSGWVRCDE
jgi:hypothetical protein